MILALLHAKRCTCRARKWLFALFGGFHAIELRISGLLGSQKRTMNEIKSRSLAWRARCERAKASHQRRR
jgi:hypothetical protein